MYVRTYTRRSKLRHATYKELDERLPPLDTCSFTIDIALLFCLKEDFFF